MQSKKVQVIKAKGRVRVARDEGRENVLVKWYRKFQESGMSKFWNSDVLCGDHT